MSTFIEVVNRYISPYYNYIIVIFALTVFIIIGKYSYDKFYSSKVNDPEKKFKDVANAAMRPDGVNILFFHADWCPHCKTALPEWTKFKNQYHDTEVNGYVINCTDINCTSETSDVTKAINEYKIDSYPTIKMVKGDQKIEFDSKITQKTLEQFVNTMLAD